MTGEEMRAIRERLELSQWAFGKRVGVRGDSVSRWERGDRKISESIAILVRQIEELARLSGVGVK